jgi:hypothetical protein
MAAEERTVQTKAPEAPAESDRWEKSKQTFQGYESRLPYVFLPWELIALPYSKRASEYYDPCQEAANKSIKCMYRNNGDREMCQDYFQCVTFS